MAISVQQGIPAVITEGDAVSFLVDDSNFPAGTWTSSLVFKTELNAVTAFAGVQSGTSHLFELSNAQTLTLTPGRNLVCVIFSDGTHRETSQWKDLLILADPSAAQTPSFAQSQVTLLQSLIASIHASGATTVNFNGQSFTRANVNELETQLTQWEARLYQEKEQEKADRGLPFVGNRIPVRFVC